MAALGNRVAILGLCPGFVHPTISAEARLATPADSDKAVTMQPIKNRQFYGTKGPKGGLRNISREPPVAAPGRRGAILGHCPGFVHPATSP